MKKSYEDLYIWQAGVDLAAWVAAWAKDVPWHHRALMDQLQRSAVSIPSNIAEGKGRLSQREFRQFLGIARGSLYELATQVEIAFRLQLLSEEHRKQCMREINKIGAGINNLLRRLRMDQLSS